MHAKITPFFNEDKLGNAHSAQRTVYLASRTPFYGKVYRNIYLLYIIYIIKFLFRHFEVPLRKLCAVRCALFFCV